MYRDPLATLGPRAATLFAALSEAWARAEERFAAERLRADVFAALEPERFQRAETLRAAAVAIHEPVVVARSAESVEIWAAYVAKLETAIAAIEALEEAYVAWSAACAVPARTILPFPAPNDGSAWGERAASDRLGWRRAALASVLTGADAVLEKSAGATWLRMTIRRRELPFALIVDTASRGGVVGIATTVPALVPSFVVAERSFGDELASMFRFRGAPETETGDEAFDGIFRVRLTKPFDEIAGGQVGRAVLATLGPAARKSLVQLAHFEVPRVAIGRGRAELWLSEGTCFEGERGGGRSALREIVHTAMDALAALRAPESDFR